MCVCVCVWVYVCVCAMHLHQGEVKDHIGHNWLPVSLEQQAIMFTLSALHHLIFLDLSFYSLNVQILIRDQHWSGLIVRHRLRRSNDPVSAGWLDLCI